MNKIINKMFGAICSVAIGLSFTACEHDDDYVTVASSPIIGTWDISEGYDDALQEKIPAYEYLFQTREFDENTQQYEPEFKDDDPERFDGVDRPEKYDRVVFTADLDGGKATFYKKDASGNLVQGPTYLARYSENTVKLYNNRKIGEDTYWVPGEGGFHDGSTYEEVTEEKDMADLTLFKEFAVENLDGGNLRLVWNHAERIGIPFTNQYERYNFVKVG